MAKVFISSTSIDLRDYRDAAIEECNRLGLVPIAMEFFEAMAFGAAAGSKQKLDGADLYVGIFAHRYGYIEEGQDKGITEIEFDHATERGLDRLCFLVDPDWPWPDSLIDRQNDARLAAFKAGIEKSVIRALFRSPEDFQGKLRLALTEWARGAPDAARPQPPLSLKQLTPTAQNRLRYGARQAPFAGRTGEMATLNSFVDSSAPFSWMVVDGPAGSGKSRLVQEFCLALAPSWRAGFLLPVQRFEAWSSWQSEANTVVAIDYAAERVDEIRMILLALAARAQQQRGHFRVRVLLVERHARGDWMDRLIGSRSDGYAIEAARFSESPLTLGPLSDEELWSSVRSLMERAGKQPPAAEALLERLREIDPLRRPLFAILAADALIAGRNVREWDRERLMRDVLARERERWAKMGVTPLYENLLALAAMVGDLTEEALQNPPPGVALPAYKDFDREVYSVMTGTDVGGDGIPALKPDLLGEFFVLEHVKGRNECVTAGQVADLLDLAWKVRGGSTRTDRFKVGMISVAPTNLPLFLHRLAIEDFADHPAAPHFLARPRAPGADLTYWPTLAAQGIAHYVNSGRIDRAKTLNDDLCGFEGMPDAPFDTAGAIASAGLSLLRHFAGASTPEADELRLRLRERAFAPSAEQTVREKYARGAGEIVLALRAGPQQALVEALLADQRELVRLHPDEEELRVLHAASLAQMVQPGHPLESRERWFETLRLFAQDFNDDVRLYPSLAWAARLLCEVYANMADRFDDAERTNSVVRGLTRLRSQRPLYKLPDIFQGEDPFAWTPVQEDLRRLRLLLVESDLALIYPLMRAQRLREADHLLEEMHDLWWRYNRQDREFAKAYSGAIMRHADASAASGNYEQVPKAIAVLQEIAGNFPEEPAFQTYSSRLSLNAVKHAIGRAGLAEAASLHAGLRDLTSPSSGEQSLVADFAEASVALCIAYQEHSKWEELFSLAKTTAWAVRSEALHERIIAKGGETTWTETAQWLDGVLAAAR